LNSPQDKIHKKPNPLVCCDVDNLVFGIASAHKPIKGEAKAGTSRFLFSFLQNKKVTLSKIELLNRITRLELIRIILSELF